MITWRIGWLPVDPEAEVVVLLVVVAAWGEDEPEHAAAVRATAAMMTVNAARRFERER